MTPDEELMVIFGALHVVALALGVVLFMMFLRSDSASSWKPPEDEEGGGGGGNDRLPSSKPKPRPTGGVPLPDAEPVAHAPARPLASSATPHPRPLRRPAASARAAAARPARAAASSRSRARSGSRAPAAPRRRRSAAPRAAPARTGRPAARCRRATRPAPLPTRRVSESRVLGSKLRIWTCPGRRSSAVRASVTWAQAGSALHAGSWASTARASPARLRLEQVEHLPALGARAGQPAREQERQAEEDEDAEAGDDQDGGAAAHRRAPG